MVSAATSPARLVNGGGLDVLLVARGAEPAAFAGEGQKVFVATMVAADADEAAIEVAAVQEFVDDLRDDGAQGTEAGLVVVRVGFDELGEVAVGALPEGRLSRVAGAVEVHGQNLDWGVEGPKPARIRCPRRSATGPRPQRVGGEESVGKSGRLSGCGRAVVEGPPALRSSA